MKTVDLKANRALEQDELKALQELQKQFSQLKLMIADVELKKVEILGEIGQIKQVFSMKEKELIEKYGSDSVINMQTGEITKKENG